jgi:hypothetical protein
MGLTGTDWKAIASLVCGIAFFFSLPHCWQSFSATSPSRRFENLPED